LQYLLKTPLLPLLQTPKYSINFREPLERTLLKFVINQELYIEIESEALFDNISENKES